MVEELISEIFRKIGHTWKTTGGLIHPSYKDVRRLLDEAQKTVYDEGLNDGDRFEAGRLIIEKRPEGLDIYVYVGNYKGEQ
jgi:hypothetical protein